MFERYRDKAMEELINIYDETRSCISKKRRYSVRDNGAIYRHAKEGCKPSPLDEKWTFGKKDSKTGYMLYGGVRVHQIVATAFHGNPENENM
ncbi:HNH endonuclease domain protein, partial [gut metagenome]